MTKLAIIGDNPTLLWGIMSRERIGRIARANRLELVADPAEAALLANAGFAFDPQWLKHIATRPGLALTSGGVPVLAHARSPDEAARVAEAMLADRPGAVGMETIAIESNPELVNEELRKRERPFVDRLEPATVRNLEEASYAASYKGVTDLLTKYLWPRWALWLTRLAARAGISPNMVTTVGAILCAVATIFFWYGHYWTGMALGLVFMVLDTVDGKLARCTITSSAWGNAFDHGIDLVHPPIWWYAWGVGLAAYGRPISDTTFWTIMAVIVGGYVVQRLIEGAFIAFYGMHIHVWRKLDSDFRLITARRNPNMVILLTSVIAGRPDIGLIAIAWWTALSCLFHLVRLVQAMAIKARGGTITSWLG